MSTRIRWTWQGADARKGGSAHLRGPSERGQCRAGAASPASATSTMGQRCARQAGAQRPAWFWPCPHRLIITEDRSRGERRQEGVGDLAGSASHDDSDRVLRRGAGVCDLRSLLTSTQQCTVRTFMVIDARKEAWPMWQRKDASGKDETFRALPSGARCCECVHVRTAVLYGAGRKAQAERRRPAAAAAAVQLVEGGVEGVIGWQGGLYRHLSYHIKKHTLSLPPFLFCLSLLRPVLASYSPAAARRLLSRSLPFPTTSPNRLRC